LAGSEPVAIFQPICKCIWLVPPSYDAVFSFVNPVGNGWFALVSQSEERTAISNIPAVIPAGLATLNVAVPVAVVAPITVGAAMLLC